MTSELEKILKDCLTTDRAADRMGITPAQLTGFLGKHKTLKPAKHGNAYIFTEIDIKAILKAWEATQAGCCPNCGYDLKAGKPAQVSKAADEQKDIPGLKTEVAE